MADNSQTHRLPPLSMRASFQPSTLDRKNRTVELVWTTGARVLRGFWDKFWEELSLDPKHVRMGRLNNGAPFLADHGDGWEGPKLRHVYGVVESARLEKGQGVAVVRFTREGVDPEADRVFEKIADGIVQNVSVGYRIYKLEKVEDAVDGIPVMRAIDWEPAEISGVAIGADDGAGFRNADQTPNPCEVITRGPAPHSMEGTKMDPESNDNAEQSRVMAERARNLEIRRTVRAAQMPEQMADKMIEDGISLDAARAQVIEELSKRTQPLNSYHRMGAESFEASQRGGHDDFSRAASDAMVMRAGIKVAQPHPAARDMLHTSTVDLARTCLSRAGKRHSGMSSGELVKRALTTSDYSLLLADATGKALRVGYETEPASHRLWVRTEPVPDFREQLRPILGSAPDLDKLAEHAEYRYGSLTEDSTSYRVSKYGKVIALSWELLVNDNLSAFLRMQPALGQAARRKEADTVYALFAENSGNGPTMQDGQVLWHADHKNLASTDSEITVDGLSAARLLLRKQTAVGGGYMALQPRYLILPAELETQAEILIASMTKHITTATEAEQLEWITKLIPVVEPRLSSSAYYLAAGNEQIDTVVLGMLAENIDGPIIEEEKEFINDTYRTKVRHVFGAKVLDWRGLIKVPTT